MDFRGGIAYPDKLLRLAGAELLSESGVRLGIAAVIGMGLDFLVFSLLVLTGDTPGRAQVISFLAAAGFTYLLNARGNFGRRRPGETSRTTWREAASFSVIAGMAFSLRGGVFATSAELMKFPPHLAILGAIIATGLVIFFGCSLFVLGSPDKESKQDVRSQIRAMAIVGYLFLLRLSYLGVAELLPEEAYYWNYAQHLDIGYLDHPPMVAWITWVGTHLLGDTEIAVRSGAFLSWLIAAFFCFRITRNLFDRPTAWRALLLVATLPFFFGAGFVMTPDAPLLACWAGTLSFLEGALIRGRRSAWWGAGLCAGLGMLSKYTIVLLAPGALLFMLLDRTSRRWFVRPEPYAAGILAFLLFSPVVVWNAEHQWDSFVFQGSRRFLDSFDFTLPALIGSILLLLTPTGVIAAFTAILLNTGKKAITGIRGELKRGRLFAAVFTLLPFLFFLGFSCAREAKLNWTGPLWLAAVPFIAWQMTPSERGHEGPILKFLHRMWPPTVVGTAFFLGAFLYFLALGIPGVPYPPGSNFASFAGWKDLAQQIEEIEDNIEKIRGTEPLVVGMDKNGIASELAFYRNKEEVEKGDPKEGLRYTTGRQLLGMESLMYRYWFPGQLQGETPAQAELLILVTRELHELRNHRVISSGWRIGEAKELVVKRNGIPVGKYYYAFAEPSRDSGLTDFR